MVDMVFIDLKKAFYAVDHHIICMKLESYGVIHTELTWFVSYLSNRTQHCRANGVEVGILFSKRER